MNPLEITKEIELEAKRLTWHIPSPQACAKAIHHYVATQIKYMDTDPPRPYRTAHQTLQAKSGCCGEKSYLTITLARCAGIDARYVHVEQNPPPPHACVIAYLPEGPMYLDGTSQTGYSNTPLGDKVIDFKELPDQEVHSRFLSWNQAYPQQLTEPLAIKNLMIKAGNELAVQFAKRYMLIGIATCTMILYSYHPLERIQSLVQRQPTALEHIVEQILDTD